MLIETKTLSHKETKKYFVYIYMEVLFKVVDIWTQEMKMTNVDQKLID